MTTSHPLLPMDHQIPFRQPAVTVPLNWAFGSAGPNLTNSCSSAASASFFSPHPSPSFLLPQPTPSKKESHLLPHSATSPLRTKKRGLAEHDRGEESMDQDGHQSCLQNRPVGLPKRIKTGSGYPHPQWEPQMGLSIPNQDPLKGGEVDVGKNLASLTKPELLGLIQSLIQHRPDLKAAIVGLLPPPNLESITIRLEEVELKLIERIPNKRTNRQEYVWSTVRIPLSGYVQDCLGWLRVIDETHQAGRVDAKNESTYQQISSEFNILNRLSLSIKKVEGLLPCQPTLPETPAGEVDRLNQSSYNLLQNDLIPTLFDSWRAFLERVERMIFVEGIILGESLINRWFNQLDELAVPPSSSPLHFDHFKQDELGDCARLLSVIRDEARSRFGKLVGLRASSLHSAHLTTITPSCLDFNLGPSWHHGRFC